MEKIIKIISIILMLMVVASIVFPVFATPITPNILNPNVTTDTARKTKSISGIIIGSVQVTGIAVAIIMLAVLAIKYMVSAAADKAEIKKHAAIYIVGAICLFGATGILQIIKSFADQIEP